MNDGGYKNKLLQNLEQDSIYRLKLRPVMLEAEHEMESPGCAIGHLVFVEEGVGVMAVTFTDGSQVEVGLFGCESVMGVSALMGTRHSLNRVYMQIQGFGYQAPMQAAREEFRRFGTFHDLALRYVQAQLTQSTQSAACNAKHEVHERLARWLLLCADRAGSDRFRMSHEHLAEMLGSTRPTVSTTAAVLKEEGLIEYTRGTIRIVDFEGLERRSCECYRVVKNHLDTYTEFDTGFSV
ncbi:MAG: Crp/Fnr family transcriptional regulator [Acidobacteriota bacterium]|nr:Crp/Fnr family transcriptional regulator [Acidobacteriota bacterium]